MTSAQLECASSLLGLAGGILLSFPAFYAAKYGHLAWRLRNYGPIEDKPAAVKAYNDLMASLTTLQGDWTPRMSGFLVAGTISTVLSSVLSVMKAFLF